MLALCSRKNYRMSEALRLRVPDTEQPVPGGLLGLELEFSARLPRGNKIHFGSLIHRLPIDGEALDPGDPNAYRCSWGGVITCDGAEAEIATPPVRTRPGFADELRAWTEAGEAALRRAVPREISLDGYSAHISAAMPARLNDRVCQLYAETFAVGLMLLMDRADSPGLLVRPRPGRIELCGEFIQAEQVPAAAAFAAGSARACATAVHGNRSKRVLPPRLAVVLARAVQRYGWYVDHRAFGADLHDAPRRTLLLRASGGTISAQSYLELAWAAAREALADDAAASDVEVAEAMISGSLPLPAEQDRRRSLGPGRLDGPGQDRLDGPDPGRLYGQTGPNLRDVVPQMAPPRLSAHLRPGFTLRPVAVTWDFTVFETASPAQKAYTCVPRDSLAGFLGELEAGALDRPIASYLALRSRNRILAAHPQTRRLGIYDRMEAPAALLAPERDPQTGRRQSAPLTTKRRPARAGKRNRPEPEQRPRRRPRRRRQPSRTVMAIVAAVILAGAGVAVAWPSLGIHRSYERHGNHGPRAIQAADPLFLHPGALSFPDILVNSTFTRSLTVRNNGRSPLTAVGLRFIGSSRADFSLPGQPSRGSQPPPCLQHLLPSQTCKILVTFTPSTPGQHQAYLRIYFSKSQRPENVTLTGTGSADAVPRVHTTPSRTPTPTPSHTSTPTPTPSVSPKVTGVSLRVDPLQGGHPVIITGSGLMEVTNVDFGQTPGSISARTDTQITVVCPPSATAGVVNLTVVVGRGQSATIIPAGQFTYAT
jgi:IPT/TIG domain-containing protein/centrosomal CEP192-like protein